MAGRESEPTQHPKEQEKPLEFSRQEKELMLKQMKDFLSRRRYLEVNTLFACNKEVFDKFWEETINARNITSMLLNSLGEKITLDEAVEFGMPDQIPPGQLQTYADGLGNTYHDIEKRKMTEYLLDEAKTTPTPQASKK